MTKRHMRKYRARYWANNQIEDLPQDSDESEEEESPTPEPESVLSGEADDLTKALVEPATDPTAVGQPTAVDINEELQPECESSSEDIRAQSSEEELFDENAQPIRYKLIDIKDPDQVYKPF